MTDMQGTTSNTPTRKVLTGAVVAALAAVVMAVLRQYNVDVGDELGNAITVVAGALSAYLVPSPENRPPGQLS